ncbi:hypothetical protein [Mesorhizobium loti]|uniref:hypothetical protein n=1 Tax=Rhizobium loti TaxID=381 RepID=UPI000AEDDAD7|nr:hypothetical protein [Mesorhizobium loti]
MSGRTRPARRRRRCGRRWPAGAGGGAASDSGLALGPVQSRQARPAPAGHPGAAYIPELIELAKRAKPLRRGPLFDVDTTRPIDFDAITAWLRPKLLATH